MSKGKGRKLTRSQMSILMKNGYNPDDYLYLKTVTESKSDHLKKIDDKTQYMYILNRVTGKKEIIQM